VVTHPAGFFDGELQDLLRAWSQIGPAPGMTTNSGQSLHHLLHPGRLEAQLPQHLSGNTPLFPDQPKQDVLGPDVIMMQALCLFMSQT
jgi:hypothetical protein